MISTEHPRPSHVFAHFSDTHLPAERSPLYGAADADGHLEELLAVLERSAVRPDALIFSGDLADRGDVSSYERLRVLVEPVARRLGSAIVWASGNHDDRAALRRVLLDGEGAEPVCSAHRFGGLRVLVLDSNVPGLHHGELDDDRLSWLSDQLAEPAPEGTLLVMHHPPLPTVLDLAVTVELRDQHRLAEVLRGSDVRGILSGHIHHPSMGVFAGIPVSVASSTAYTQDLGMAPTATRGQDGAQSFNLVQVYADTVVHSVVSFAHYADVGEPVAAADVERRLAAAGIERRGAL